MGLRGPAPKPTALKRYEGNPGKQKLSSTEPEYPPGLPAKPKRMSAAAGRVWNELVEEMAGPAILRRVDKRALQQLCEDEAILENAYENLWKMADLLKKKAEAEGRTLPAGPMAALLAMTNGRLAMSSIRDLAARVIIERREFGLTPSARSRVTASRISADNALDDAIFNRGAEIFLLPKTNA